MEVCPPCADVAELADALDSGSSFRKEVEVQVLSSAPTQVSPKADPNQGRLLYFAPHLPGHLCSPHGHQRSLARTEAPQAPQNLARGVRSGFPQV